MCCDAEIVFVAFPQVDEAPDVVDEPVMFMRGVGAPYGVDEQPIEVCAVHPIKGDLVIVPESARAEVEVALGLEVLICQSSISRELGVVRQILTVGDVEVAPGLQVILGTSPSDGAKRAPFQERL